MSLTCFLTSSPGGYTFGPGGRIPCPLDASNDFIVELRSRWPSAAQLLFIASDPDNPARLEEMADLLAQSFRLSGLPVAGYQLCHRPTQDQVSALLTWANVLILCGGHVPTQNRFLAELDLKPQLQHFNGLLIGISAGSMNSAELVYAHPELEGEAIDPEYPRWIPGLGLTEMRILPHLDSLRGDTLDGLDLIEDIALPDSHVHSFYGLPDGSWLLVENGVTTLHGPATYFANGVETPINSL